MRESYGCGLKTLISEADPGEGANGQTEARRAEKHFFLNRPPPLISGSAMKSRG